MYPSPVKAHPGMWTHEFVDAAAKHAVHESTALIPKKKLGRLAQLPKDALAWLFGEQRIGRAASSAVLYPLGLWDY